MTNTGAPHTNLIWKSKILGSLLKVPVFYRVLIANSVIIFVGATGGTYLATRLNTISYAPLIIFVTVGWLVSVALNFVFLQIAFRPLLALGKVMNRVQGGERSLRAPLTGLDPQADQLAQTFNMMLDTIDAANRQRAAQIINAQEEERKRVARELHDETSQVLTSLLISLAILEESITSQEARKRIADTRQLAHQTLRAIRNLSLDLRPSALDDLGLLPALRWYIKEYQQKFPITVEFQTTGIKERLSAELETVLYRIVQEALTNVARHSGANKVCVILTEKDHTIDASITDNGHGFNVDNLQKKPGVGQVHGWGLVGMHERAQLLGGLLTINSTPKKGTEIRAHIPILPIGTQIDMKTPLHS
ncbi:MAG TPA: HAMP domain-containing sensor histidine kinase [Dictyobacter sp.]|jgi:two-component system sensor histidine kinase UhpB|nr:HAMP domain-containing sensor histidine kinase [Dictyobacter sp.]